MCSGDPRDWFTVMSVFPCGMLQTAVSYPLSESFVVLTQLVLPGVFYWSENPSSPPIFCLCLSVCKLLILLPCKSLLAHVSPSLCPSVHTWGPSGAPQGNPQGSAVVPCRDVAAPWFLSRLQLFCLWAVLCLANV